jgi:hypothetical protein
LHVVLVSPGVNRNGSQEKKRPEVETFAQAKGEQALCQEKEQPQLVVAFGHGAVCH